MSARAAAMATLLALTLAAIPDESLHAVCSRADAHFQAAMHFQAINTSSSWTECPSEDALLMLQELKPAGPVVALDVGCNKGYTSRDLFALWAPGLAMGGRDMYALYAGMHPDLDNERDNYRLCGSCGDCWSRLQPVAVAQPQQQQQQQGQPPRSLREKAAAAADSSSAAAKGIAVHCFEPSSGNFAMLQAAHERFLGGGAGEAAGASWVLHNAAVGQHAGTVKIQRDCRSELCSLHGTDSHFAKGMVDVRMEAVDDYCDEHDLHTVDVLKIDTEGHDPAVLDGAKRLLKRGGVTMLTFEHNGGGEWAERRLQDVVHWLGDLPGNPYVCYYMGQRGRFTRLTGCWVDEYDASRWSNVVCAPRAHELAARLERGSFIYQHLQHNADLQQQHGGLRQQAGEEGQDEAARRRARS